MAPREQGWAVSWQHWGQDQAEGGLLSVGRGALPGRLILSTCSYKAGRDPKNYSCSSALEEANTQSGFPVSKSKSSQCCPQSLRRASPGHCLQSHCPSDTAFRPRYSYFRLLNLSAKPLPTKEPPFPEDSNPKISPFPLTFYPILPSISKSCKFSFKNYTSNFALSILTVTTLNQNIISYLYDYQPPILYSPLPV